MVSGEAVWAIVVTYNRVTLLQECLRALQQQSYSPGAIVVVDNASTEDVPAVIRQLGYTVREQIAYGEARRCIFAPVGGGSRILIHYLRLPVNLGGAGGFHYGIRLAMEQGAHWMWLMDDDAEPAPDALEHLLAMADAETAAAWGSLTRSARTGEVEPYHQCRLHFQNPLKQFLIPLVGEDLEHLDKVPIDQKSFVGLLIPRRTVERVGLPKKEMFLHWDDTEYCLRMRKVGKIYLVPRSVIWHKDAVEKSVRVPYRLGFIRLMRYAKRDSYERYWLRYYTIRNMVWLALQVSEQRYRTVWQIITAFLRAAGGILLFDDHRWRRLRLLWQMYWDGARGVFEDLWKPRRLLYDEAPLPLEQISAQIENVLQQRRDKEPQCVH